KADYGALVQMLGYADTCAEDMTFTHFAGHGFFDLGQTLALVTIDDVNNAVRELFARDRCTISILR
ncbi:MAG: hypothetical protein IJ723_05875, partial [Ruminococcus sp.]|nr:hypothetical protein [Ruminococcus sp.]